MRVAFLLDSLGGRGVQLTAWAYAHFNETHLRNNSVIVVNRSAHADVATPDCRDAFRAHFTERFEVHELEQAAIDPWLLANKVDVCYVPCSGTPDNFVPTSVPTLVHSVFTADFPSGTLHTTLSNWLSRGRVPVLPNMVCLGVTQDDMRSELGIPPAATVFGRHGGWHTFDVPCARKAVVQVAQQRPDTFFVFMHTEPFVFGQRNVIFLDGTCDLVAKRRFINTCDFMVHGRLEGETFGCACGEFAACYKPVITYAHSHDKAHIDILGDKAVLYADKDQLLRLLADPPAVDMRDNGYLRYLPARVSPLFNAALHQCLAQAPVPRLPLIFS